MRLIPVEVPRLKFIGLDARLLGFSFLISLLAGILFGLAPALRFPGRSHRIAEKIGRASGSERVKSTVACAMLWLSARSP